MPRILCLSFSDIRSDSRVLRQVGVLAEFGEVTTLCYGDRPDPATEHLQIDESLPSLPQTPSGVLRLGLRRYRSLELAAPAVAAAYRLARGKRFDLIVANEARAVPLALRLSAELEASTGRGSVPVWGDLHEWAPEERVHVLSWRLLIKPFMTDVCRRYLPRLDAVTAVNEPIAQLYRERFGIACDVVRNAGPYQQLTPSAPAQDIRLVHSGGAVPGRNLEGTIDAAIALGEGYTLDLYLVKARDGGKYWNELKERASTSDRITFHDAVAPADLARTLNQYDVGIFSLPPRTVNHRFMLPNKFFDFVQARLAVVFGPSPVTTELIEQHALGAVAADFSTESLVRAVQSLSREQIQTCKQHADAAARELSSEREEEVERTILRRLLPASSDRSQA
ncbi:glycosyltransferase [Tersicoccus sp. MR15.9]|uniref:glycosyltransferase n=1 Tax=Tersicoccus mangrovi TaxID=3121635 RepID=UPI002FE65C11